MHGKDASVIDTSNYIVCQLNSRLVTILDLTKLWLYPNDFNLVKRVV